MELLTCYTINKQECTPGINPSLFTSISCIGAQNHLVKQATLLSYPLFPDLMPESTVA